MSKLSGLAAFVLETIFKPQKSEKKSGPPTKNRKKKDNTTIYEEYSSKFNRENRNK